MSAALRAAWLLRSALAGRVEADAEVAYDSGGITALRSGAAPQPVGRAATLLMPPLANAHDHGRGLKTLAYGVADAALEAWVPATYTLPPVDPYLVAAAAFCRMARSGIGYAVHCHLSRDPCTLVREAQAVARAARDVGIRIAFVVPLRDRPRLAYGRDEDVLRHLDAADAAAIRARMLRPVAPADEQVHLVDEIASACASEMFQVQYGPVGVEWCSDALLRRVADRSAATGRRVHMHLLESRYQREWHDASHPAGIVNHIDALGLLSPRLTVAHGTWLRPDECELLAHRGVVVSINTSSNLRLRSGVAPLRHIHEAGVRFAVGLDALGLDDDDDLLRELRLLRLLHAGQGFAPGVPPEAVLDGACRHGAAVAGCVAGGELAAGAPADLLLLDLRREMADLAPPLDDVLAVLHGRATRGSVDTMVIAGRTVVAAGRVTGLDEEALQAELTAQWATHAGATADSLPLLHRYQGALAAFYGAGGHREPGSLRTG